MPSGGTWSWQRVAAGLATTPQCSASGDEETSFERGEGFSWYYVGLSTGGDYEGAGI